MGLTVLSALRGVSVCATLLLAGCAIHPRTPAHHPVSSKSISIPPKFTTPANSEAGLASIERQFRRNGDRRGVFAVAYLVTTRQIRADIHSGLFHDRKWADRGLVIFANLYRDALLNYQSGCLDRVPPAWRASFDAAASNHVTVLEDLVLGVSAHINRDLPFALEQAGIQPDPTIRYRDFLAVNHSLEAIVDDIQDCVARDYAPGLRQIETLSGRLDETVVLAAIRHARNIAWRHGVCLITAPTIADRNRVAAEIEAYALAQANRFLAPGCHMPWLARQLACIEQRGLWPVASPAFSGLDCPPCHQ
ncbi:MAG: hypothetical protein K1X53_03390 [Candidatus Sumerlaeaceae bacterium]|nr:hypothetical protein [Candidatus Sumerlaeaceae bacterium]